MLPLLSPAELFRRPSIRCWMLRRFVVGDSVASAITAWIEARRSFSVDNDMLPRRLVGSQYSYPKSFSTSAVITDTSDVERFSGVIGVTSVTIMTLAWFAIEGDVPSVMVKYTNGKTDDPKSSKLRKAQ
jgi:hypothetical protein